MTYAPYRDPSLPVEQRVADLLARLTLEEKAGQLTQYFYFAQTVEIPEGFDLSTLPPEHLAYVTQPRQVEAALDAGAAGLARGAAGAGAEASLAAWPGPIPGRELLRHRAIVVADTSQELIARTLGVLEGQDTLRVPDIRAKASAQVAGFGIGHLPRFRLLLLLLLEIADAINDLGLHLWRCVGRNGEGRRLRLRCERNRRGADAQLLWLRWQ